MSKIFKDSKTINEARILRAEVLHILPSWDDAFRNFKSENKKDRLIMSQKLAVLLNCNTPHFMFWSSSRSAVTFCGVQEHVIAALRKLVSPHGRTFYKMLLIKFGEIDESRNDTKASST